MLPPSAVMMMIHLIKIDVAMKKSVFIIAMMAACSFIACQKEQERKLTPVDEPEKEVVLTTISASAGEAETKTSVDGLQVKWSKNDVIAVADEDENMVDFELQGEGGAASGSFDGDLGGKALGIYAVYPNTTNSAVSGSTVYVDYLNTWSYGKSEVPMYGVNDGTGAYAFHNIGGAIQVSYSHVPAAAKYFYISETHTGGAKKYITGTVIITDLDSTPAVDLSYLDGQSVLIDDVVPDGSGNVTVVVPIPAGTGYNFSVELLDDGFDPIPGSVKNATNKTVAANRITRFPVIEIPKVDVIDRALTGIGAGSGYGDWSGKNGSSSSAVYAGNSAGGKSADNPSLQIRSTNNSGIITTTTGGLAKQVEVFWNSALTIDRTINVYGCQSSYTSTADLFAVETQGNLLGTISFDSSDPSTSNTLSIAGDYPFIGLCSSSGAIYIDQILVSWVTDNRPTLTAPTFSEAEGEIPMGTSVTLSSAESGTIHYTTNGSVPTESSATYSAGIVVNDDVTIKAIAVKDGYKNSPVATVSYTVPVCAAPTFDTLEGSISSGSDVTIVNNEAGSVIYYTTDGSEPDGSSSYGAAGADVVIADITSLTTIKAFSRKAGKKDSSISEATYSISGGPATPLVAPSTITFEPYSSTFTATWESNANATGYEWVISTSSTSAGINLATDPHGSFTVANPAAGGASLSSGTWTLSNTATLSISTRYYFYVLVKGDGSTYSDSGYSSPANKIVPLVITVANVTAGSYSSSETEFTNNSKKFGYVQVMKNGKGSPTNWAASQTTQFKGNSTTPGILYNKDALGTSIKNIRIYLAVNNNAFTLAYGTNTDVSTGSKTRTQYTYNDSFTLTVNHKDGGTLDATVNYYDFDLSSYNVNYFKLTNGSGANYVWKIEVTYQ